MSTAIEDRLSAALHARAEQVRADDLRPATAPVTRLHRRLPRVAAWSLAAAACAAAVAVPFVLGGGPEPSPQPAPPAPSVTPTPNGDQVEGGDWTQAYAYPRAYDVDGDGRPDRLVIRTESTEWLPAGLRRMEVELSTGGVAAVLLEYDTYDLTAIEPVELDGDPGDEILYYRGTVDDGRDIGVVDLVEGALVDLSVPDDPGLTATSTEREGWRGRHYWVDDRRLYTLRTVDGGFVPGGSNPTSPPYAVEVWQWRLTDGELVAVPQARQCWDGAPEEPPAPC